MQLASMTDWQPFAHELHCLIVCIPVQLQKAAHTLCLCGCTVILVNIRQQQCKHESRTTMSSRVCSSKCPSSSPASAAMYRHLLQQPKLFTLTLLCFEKESIYTNRSPSNLCLHNHCCCVCLLAFPFCKGWRHSVHLQQQPRYFHSLGACRVKLSSPQATE